MGSMEETKPQFKEQSIWWEEGKCLIKKTIQNCGRDKRAQENVEEKE